MKSNVLISSAGRRVELVQAFKSSLDRLLPNAKLFCTDMNPEFSPACHIADKFFKAPRVTDTGYMDYLLALCVEHDIGLVIPTIDTELQVLARGREKFAQKGIHLVISDEELINFCRDKRKTTDLFSKLSIDQPAILDKYNLSFPCFCKPYDGSCSIGAIALLEHSDLTNELLSNPKNMFMELIPKSYCEYTIDAYYSDGVLKCLVPRKRLEVRSGEVSKGITRKNFVYDYLMDKVGVLEGARGCITFQLFVNEETKSIKGLEINPRFGGGYPLSHDAGAQFSDWLVREYLQGGEVDFYDSWKNNLLMLRYDAKVLIHEDK